MHYSDRAGPRPRFLWSAFLLVVVCSIVAPADSPELTSWTVTFDSGHPAHVVAPGEEKNVALVLRNQGDAAAAGTVRARVESFDGTSVEARAELKVAAGETHRWPLPTRLFGELGIKHVHFSTKRGGRQSEPKRAAFAYMRPAGLTRSRDDDGFLFGIAYGAGPDNHAPRSAQRSALCGVSTARGHPVWPRIERQPEQWDWSSCDAIIDVHGEHGVQVQFLLSGAPRWSWQREGTGVPTVAAWSRFCQAIAARYRGRVEYYELRNESDIDFFRGTQDQYIELLRSGYAAIRAGDPTAQVTTGGFASWGHGQSKPGMVSRVIRECQDSYDLIAHHRHGDFGMFRRELEQHLLPLCRDALSKPRPLYFTETGMDTRHGPRFQAQTLPKKIALAWASGAVAYTWFNLHDMQAAKHDRQPGFTYGLYTKLRRIDEKKRYTPENMNYDGAWPKAAYVSYSTLITLLRGKRLVTRVALGDDEFAFVFSGASEHVVLSWREKTGVHLPRRVLRTEADRLERVDLMGNRRPWPLTNGLTELSLSEEPAYLVFFGGEPPHLEVPAAEAPRRRSP